MVREVLRLMNDAKAAVRGLPWTAAQNPAVEELTQALEDLIGVRDRDGK